MDYSLIIGLISFLSAGAITFFTIKKSKADKAESESREQRYNTQLQSARDTIVDLQNKADKQSAEYYKTSAKSLDSLNDQQNKLIEQQTAVISLQESNQKKALELFELQNQVNMEITGGDSFCYLDIRISPNYLDKKTKFIESISLINAGSYPLQNIQISLEKPQLKWNKSMLEDFVSSKTDPNLNYSFYIPYLAENKNKKIKNGVLLLERPIPDSQLINLKITYAATITLRKGIYNQIFKLSQVKGAWFHAFIILSDYDSSFKPFTDISPSFPDKKQDGSVDWKMIETNNK